MLDLNKENKSGQSKNGKEQGGKFHSKTIKHDPQSESARAVFGLNRDDTLQNEKNK